MEVIGRECRFAVHLKKNDERPDTHIVREVLHYEDGTKKPNLRVLENYSVPFWVTKKSFRNHRDKKEYEHTDRLIKYASTVSDLPTNIGMKLGMSKKQTSLHTVRNSPYLYGIDVSSEVHIKNSYLKLWPDLSTPATVATLDIESDITKDGEPSVIISVSTLTSVKLFYIVDIMDNTFNHEETLDNLFAEHIKPKYLDLYNNIIKKIPTAEKNIELVHTHVAVKDERELIVKTFEYIHSLKCDFLAIWNIGYDLPNIIKGCDRNNLEYTDVFCDPSLDKKHRHFEYKPGSASKVTASGGFKPKSFQEIWNMVICTSYFFIIDQATVHYYRRLGSKSIPTGYSLDSILKLTLGEEAGKMKFVDTIKTNLVKADWHKFMLKEHPCEYSVYNEWDTLPMNLIDLVTGDLSSFTYLSVRDSTLTNFASNPKKIVDSMHSLYLSLDTVFGCKPTNMSPDETLGGAGWIMQLLPSNISTKLTVGFFGEDNTRMIPNTRAYVFDLDQVSAYPSNAIVCNISKATTITEILDVEGVDIDVFKKENLNMFNGVVNNLEYTTNLYNTPTVAEIFSMYEKEHAI